jgi:hypothetical protein
MKEHRVIHLIHAICIKVPDECLEGRTGSAFDVNLGTVTLLEPITEHGPEVFTPGGQIGLVGVGTLLVHHKVHIVKRAGLKKVVPDIGCKGRLEYWRQAEQRQGHGTAITSQTANAVIPQVHNHNVPIVVHCNSDWPIELSRGYSISISMTHLTSACQSGNLALWCDIVNTMVAIVSHDGVAVPIHCDSVGLVELSNSPFSVSLTFYASACQSGHMALWCDLADTMVVSVSHNDIPVPIHCDSTGISELSNGRYSVSIT